MKIEILYFHGCPNYGPTVEQVKEALRQEGLTADIVEINVGDDSTARSVRFLGSPSRDWYFVPSGEHLTVAGGLHFEHFLVATTQTCDLVVSAFFGDSAVFQHYDAISHAHSGESM